MVLKTRLSGVVQLAAGSATLISNVFKPVLCPLLGRPVPTTFRVLNLLGFRRQHTLFYVPFVSLQHFSEPASWPPNSPSIWLIFSLTNFCMLSSKTYCCVYKLLHPRNRYLNTSKLWQTHLQMIRKVNLPFEQPILTLIFK